METKHTKGNWFAHDGQIYPEETGKTLALIPYFDKENEEEQANAKLIAGAPNLLKACMKVQDAFLPFINDGIDEHFKECMKEINRAIANAIY